MTALLLVASLFGGPVVTAAPDGGPAFHPSAKEVCENTKIPCVEYTPGVWLQRQRVPTVEVLPGIDVPADEAVPTAQFLADYAIEHGTARRIEGELVEVTPKLDMIVAIKACETGSMSWHERGSNPRYEGPLQYDHATWVAMDPPTRWPWEASIGDQVATTERLLTVASVRTQFPGCARKLGLS